MGWASSAQNGQDHGKGGRKEILGPNFKWVPIQN